MLTQGDPGGGQDIVDNGYDQHDDHIPTGVLSGSFGSVVLSIGCR